MTIGARLLFRTIGCALRALVSPRTTSSHELPRASPGMRVWTGDTLAPGMQAAIRIAFPALARIPFCMTTGIPVQATSPERRRVLQLSLIDCFSFEHQRCMPGSRSNPGISEPNRQSCKQERTKKKGRIGHRRHSPSIGNVSYPRRQDRPGGIPERWWFVIGVAAIC